MGECLLISDDLPRAERLARGLGAARPIQVHDLYAEGLPNTAPALIVSDVAQLTSDAILRLRRVLERVRGEDVPLLFLAHGNLARAQAHAQVLGASDTVPAIAALSLLREKMVQLQEDIVQASAAARKLAAEARQFLIQSFFSGRPVTPDLANAGTELISRAVQESGVRDWISAVQRFDDATHQHCLLVAGLAASFATGLGLGGLQSYRLTKAALLHDVGKTRIPPSILNKPGRLSEVEMAVMRTHAALGHEMLVGSGFSPETLQVVRSHHEMINGTGYPDGLKGSEIPDLVRLVTITDIYAALIERRSYKPPMPADEAFGVLEGMAAQLDADLVRAFRPVVSAFHAPARSCRRETSERSRAVKIGPIELNRTIRETDTRS